MKINIIFPYNLVGGAFRSTYELSNQMIFKGHDVCIYIPFFPYLEGFSLLTYKGFSIFIRGIGRSIARGTRTPWFDLKATLYVVPSISDRYIRNADVIVANHWPTVNSVHELNSSKGIKFNFIRDTNPWMNRPELEKNSFKQDLNRIVVSSWLKTYLDEALGLEVEGVVPNGTNFDDFGYLRDSYQNPPTIGMMYYDHPQKGMQDGCNALKIIKEQYPDVEIQLFGLSKPKSLTFKAQFIYRPNKERLKNLYGTSDIFLFPSIQEGSGNPPREAMAAGCALVTTNVGCIPDCTIPGITALVVDPGDVDGMVKHLTNLIEKKSNISKIGKAAQKHIKQFSWKQSADKLETIFETVIAREKNKVKG